MTDRQTKVMTLLDDSGMVLRDVLFKITLSEHAAGDLMQDLFIRLYESRGFARAKDSFAYAWRTAVNLAFDWRRRERRRRDSRAETPSEVSQDSPPEILGATENAERLLDAVGRLKEPGRTVIIQRYLEQNSYDEIAQHLNKNRNHIRSICSKTLQILRRQLTSAASTARWEGGIS